MFTQTEEGVKISLFVQPNAPKSMIIGEYNGHLKIKIKAPPVEGKANDTIMEFFSEVLDIPQRRIELLKGDKSKNKTLMIRNMKIEELKSKLGLT